MGCASSSPAAEKHGGDVDPLRPDSAVSGLPSTDPSHYHPGKNKKDKPKKQQKAPRARKSAKNTNIEGPASAGGSAGEDISWISGGKTIAEIEKEVKGVDDSKHKEKHKDFVELSRDTHFGPGELKTMYVNFCKNPHVSDGAITKDEFVQMYAKQFPLKEPGQTAPYAGLLYEAFDNKKNGFMSFNDYMDYLSVSSRGSKEERRSWAFRVYDPNRTNLLKRDAILEVVSALYGMMGDDNFHAVDESTPEQRADKIFTLMDENGSGEITLREFVAGCEKDEGLANVFAFRP